MGSSGEVILMEGFHIWHASAAAPKSIPKALSVMLSKNKNLAGFPHWRSSGTLVSENSRHCPFCPIIKAIHFLCRLFGNSKRYRGEKEAQSCLNSIIYRKLILTFCNSLYDCIYLCVFQEGSVAWLLRVWVWKSGTAHLEFRGLWQLHLFKS